MKFFAATTLLLATALALPSQITKRTPTPPTHIDPILSQYHTHTGAVDHDTGKGLVLKAGRNESDVTTLLRLSFPLSTAGHDCELHFPLSAAAVATGTGRAQMFSSLRPANESSPGWPHGNLRDQHLLDVRFEVPGGAVVEGAYGAGVGAKGKFPCPAGYVMGGEIVGRGDEVHVEWVQGEGEGPYVEVTRA